MGKEDSALINLIVEVLENERVMNAARNIITGNTNVSESKPNIFSALKKQHAPEDVEMIHKLEDANAALRAEIASNLESNKRIQEDIELLKQEAADDSDKLAEWQNKYCMEKDQREKLEANIQKYTALTSPLAAYEKYCTLPESLRKDSLTYINDSNLATFILSGASAVLKLHEFIRERIQNNRTSDDLDILKYCFDVFFSIRTETYHEIFEYQPSIGEYFDSDKQIQLKGTNLGKISQVVFPGLSDKNGNIKAKAIVISEG